jgi:hypothetical protein
LCIALVESTDRLEGIPTYDQTHAHQVVYSCGACRRKLRSTHHAVHAASPIGVARAILENWACCNDPRRCTSLDQRVERGRTTHNIIIEKTEERALGTRCPAIPGCGRTQQMVSDDGGDGVDRIWAGRVDDHTI